MGIALQLVLNSLAVGGLYALVAIGFNLTYSTTKFFNLAHGAYAAVGGYVLLFVLRSVGWPVMPAAGVAMVVAGGVGYGLNRLVYQPLVRQRASSMVLLVASLGLFTMLEAILALLFTSGYQSLVTAAQGEVSFDLGGGVLTLTQVATIAAAVVAFLGLSALVRFTTFGKTVQAVGDDSQVARIVGINTERVVGYVFFIGSALAGLAGALVGLDTGLVPTIGMSLLLKGVVAAIVGGIGSTTGAFLGAFILGAVENLAVWVIPGEWKDAVAFVVLIAFLLWRPRGLVPR